MKKPSKTVYTCQACGYQTPKWMGKCPDCDAWESLVEEIVTAKPGKSEDRMARNPEPVPINQVELAAEYRLLTGIDELDRVLGGGLVPGTLVLVAGDPGIGKSTLMLQAMFGLANNGGKVLYASGEESVRQLRIRSKRLETLSDRLLVVSEINVDAILAMVDSVKPDVVVVDSIQTAFHSDLSSAPGSVSQVREAAVAFMMAAKTTGIPIFLVGHVTKDGAIAGPRLLEHMVDTVLYFEGDRNHMFRILRAVKNRFGSTNEIGVFEMNDKGLAGMANPSEVFLAERPAHAPGSVVTACMEGTRPILVELQALAGSTGFGTPRRTILGLDQNRVALLVAILEKKIGLQLMGHDIFMNVAGGVRVDEPAVDLGIISAVASSFLDKPVSDGTVVLGEVGLAGEVRAISHIDIRLAECKKMGFTRCLIPWSNIKRAEKVKDLEVLGVKNVSSAMDLLF